MCPLPLPFTERNLTGAYHLTSVFARDHAPGAGVQPAPPHAVPHGMLRENAGSKLMFMYELW